MPCYRKEQVHAPVRSRPPTAVDDARAQVGKEEERAIASR